MSDCIFVCKIQNNHMKYTEATAKELFKRLYEMNGTISMMSVSLDTIKPKQTSIYSSSLVLLSCLYISTSFLSFAALFWCRLLSEISTSLPMFSTPTYKAHKATSTRIQIHTSTHTHTHTHTDDMPQFLLSLLLSFIPIPIIRLSFSFPLWLSVKMDASAGDSWNLIHTGMEGGRQGERDGENEREIGGWEGLSVGHSDKEETQSPSDCWG